MVVTEQVPEQLNWVLQPSAAGNVTEKVTNSVAEPEMKLVARIIRGRLVLVAVETTLLPVFNRIKLMFGDLVNYVMI